MDQSHTTEQTQSGILHYWEVRDDLGTVSLSALQMADAAAVADLTAVASSAARFAALTPGGAWVFSVVQTHSPITEPTEWECPRHDNCEMDAIVSSHALPMWDRVKTAGVTDGAVYAELFAMHAKLHPAVNL